LKICQEITTPNTMFIISGRGRGRPWHFSFNEEYYIRGELELKRGDPKSKITSSRLVYVV